MTVRSQRDGNVALWILGIALGVVFLLAGIIVVIARAALWLFTGR